jgi:hypothetical protein
MSFKRGARSADILLLSCEAAATDGIVAWSSNRPVAEEEAADAAARWFGNA